MVVRKEISKDNELYLYMNGKVIYKRWLNTGQSLVFDVMAYDKYTYASYTDLDVKDSPHSIVVKARVRFKTFEEGGRNIEVYSGYRPNHFFSLDEADDSMECFMGDLQFEEPEVLELGKVYEIKIRFLLSLRIEPYLHIGKKMVDKRSRPKRGFRRDCQLYSVALSIFKLKRRAISCPPNVDTKHTWCYCSRDFSR